MKKSHYPLCFCVSLHFKIYIYIFFSSPTRPSGPSWSWSWHVRVCVCVWCPLPMQFFSRPLIGPQITWPDPGLSLVNPPSLSYDSGGGGVGGGWGLFCSKAPCWRWWRLRQRRQGGGGGLPPNFFDCFI